MPDAVKVGFVPFSTAPGAILVVFCDDTLKFGAATRKALGAAANIVKRAAETYQFRHLRQADRAAPPALLVRHAYRSVTASPSRPRAPATVCSAVGYAPAPRRAAARPASSAPPPRPTRARPSPAAAALPSISVPKGPHRTNY